jgi:Na+/proline symporter
MSTISTLLNWGSSYLVHDFYQRFLHPDSTERQLVRAGRLCTVLLMVLAGVVALYLENSLDSFQIMLQIGAGTGLLFILRWFWWRINALSEITAMLVSFGVAVYFRFLDNGTLLGVALDPSLELVVGVLVTTIAWLLVSLVTPPADYETLLHFYRRAHPGGPGWRRLRQEAAARGDAIEITQGWYVPLGIACMALGCITIYATLFATGYWIYGEYLRAVLCTIAAFLSATALGAAWLRLVAR